MLDDLPRYVTGIATVADYATLEELEADFPLRRAAEIPPPGMNLPAPPALPGGAVCAVIGREFLVPSDPDQDDECLLHQAVEIANDRDFCLRRQHFQLWQREFLRDGVTDAESVRAAVEEMRELLDEEQRVVQNSKFRTTLSRAFMVGAAMAGPAGAIIGGMFGGQGQVPVVATALGGAFLSVGQYAVDNWPQPPPGTDRRRMISAMFRDAQKRLGWEQIPQ